MRKRHLAVPVLLLCLLALGGCQIEDPYAESEEEGSGGGVSVSPQASDPAVLPNGAKETVAQFAAAWIDWTTNDAGEARETLSRLSASSLEQELLRSGQGSGALPGVQVSARVEGVVSKARGRALVLTHERVRLESGGGQAQYALYLARAERAESGWEVTEWQPVL